MSIFKHTGMKLGVKTGVKTGIKKIAALTLAVILTIGLFITLTSSPAQAESPEHFTPGSIVEFGHFDGTGFPVNRNHYVEGPGHPMRWVVMESDGTTALLLAERHLHYNVGHLYWATMHPMVAFEIPEYRPQTDAPMNSWAHSHLSTYLNGIFFTSTFTQAQQAAILDFGIGGYYDRNNNFAPVPEQRVVVPTSYELNAWFDNDPLKMASFHADHSLETPGTDAAWVWLRDPGSEPGFAMLVDGVRGADYRPEGFDVGYDFGAIRPLIRVDLTALIGAGGILHGIPQTPPAVRSTAPTGFELHPGSINTVQIELSQRIDPDGPGVVYLNDIELTGSRTWDDLGRFLTIDVAGVAFSSGAEYVLSASYFAALATGVEMQPYSESAFTTREAFAFTDAHYFGTYGGNRLLWEVVETDYYANTATLLLTERLFTAPFNDVTNAEVNSPGANEWESATIRTELGSRFGVMFDQAEATVITPQGDDYIFIPSASQYYRWFPDPAIRNSHPGNARNWWLIDSASPHLRNVGPPTHSSVAMYVTMEIGRVAHTGAMVNTIMGVRPAIMVDADFLGVFIPAPGTEHLFAGPHAGSFAVATIAGQEFNIGLGFATEQIPTEWELTQLVNNRALHGGIILTESEAQYAVPNFITQPGDNVRIVRIPRESAGIITELNLQNGHAAFHEGHGEFFFHDGQEVAAPLNLADGDIIMIYYRGWNNPPWVYKVTVSVVADEA